MELEISKQENFVIKMYSLYNNKARFYLNPLMGRPEKEHDHNFIREMIGEYLSKMSEIDGQDPAEFDLFYIGTFNTETGKINSEKPEHICNCLQLISDEYKTSECPVCKKIFGCLLEIPKYAHEAFENNNEECLINVACKDCYNEIIEYAIETVEDKRSAIAHEKIIIRKETV